MSKKHGMVHVKALEFIGSPPLATYVLVKL